MHSWSVSHRDCDDLYRWQFPVLPSPFRGHARDDVHPTSAGTMKGTNMTKRVWRQIRTRKNAYFPNRTQKRTNLFFRLLNDFIMWLKYFQFLYISKRRDAKILGAWSPWRLNFVGWSLIFPDPQYGTCSWRLQF